MHLLEFAHSRGQLLHEATQPLDLLALRKEKEVGLFVEINWLGHLLRALVLLLRQLPLSSP